MNANDRYDGKELQAFAAAVFERLGVPEEDAGRTADSLVRADLEGHDSHGISRLPVYARRLREGRINPRPNPVFERKGAVLLANGDNGLGQAVALRAMEAAYPIADELGTASIFIRGSNHFGTAAYLCQQAAGLGYASIVMTNSPPGIPPWGGKRAYLGTNPIAFGFPAKDGEPSIVSDLSSSVAARGKIMMANKRGEPIPVGWAIDEDGSPTTDAARALQGAVLPVGGAKGYALALAVEMLAGVMTQAAFGPHVGNLYREGDGPANVGHFILLFKLGFWMETESYLESVRRLAEEVKGVPRAAGTEEILLPGERRFRTAAASRLAGIPVPPDVVRELEQWGELCGVGLPRPIPALG